MALKGMLAVLGPALEGRQSVCLVRRCADPRPEVPEWWLRDCPCTVATLAPCWDHHEPQLQL